MKFMKQILLATVSAMFLLVFASAADLPIVEDYAAPDCGISTDDYEAVPACKQSSKISQNPSESIPL